MRPQDGTKPDFPAPAPARIDLSTGRAGNSRSGARETKVTLTYVALHLYRFILVQNSLKTLTEKETQSLLTGGNALEVDVRVRSV